VICEKMVFSFDLLLVITSEIEEAF
jgi:hypothetical protein